MPRKLYYFGLAAFWGLALAVGQIGLANREASRDETSTLLAISHRWPALARMVTEIDIVHVCYYTLLKLWATVVPPSLYSLRLFSVLCLATAAIVTIWLVNYWTRDRWAAVASGLVMLCLPRTVAAATDARSFAFTVLLLAATVAALSYTWKTGARWWLAAALVAVMSMSFVAVLLFFGPLLLFALAARHRSVSLAIAVGLTVSLPVVLLAKRQSAQISWIEPTTPTDLLEFPVRVFVPRADGPVLWAWLAFLICFAVAGWRGGETRSFTITSWLLAFGFPVALIGVGHFIPMYHQRYATIAVLGVAWLAGLALAQRPKWWTIVTVVACLALAWPPAVQIRAIGQPTTDEKVACITNLRQPGDGIWVINDDLFFWYPSLLTDGTDLTETTPVRNSRGIRPGRNSLPEVDLTRYHRVVASLPHGTNADIESGTKYLLANGYVGTETSCGNYRMVVYSR